MSMKATLTARIVPAIRLLPVAALQAFLGCVRLINTFDGDSSKLGFVLDHPSKLAKGPLVKALVHSLSVAHPITDAANIADPDRRDTSLKEHLHDLPAQFVKEVRDLVVDVLELLALGSNELLPAIRTALFTVDLRVELGFEAVLVVSESAELTTVDREGVLTREDSGEMLLSEIDSGNLVSGGSVNGVSLVLGTHNESARALPDLDGARFFIDRPVDQNRVLSALGRQAKHAVTSERHALIGPSEHVVSLVRALRRVAPPVVVVPGVNRFVELLRDFLSRLRGKYIMALTVPPPHGRLTGPVVLSVYRAPVPFADRVPQIRRRPGQPFKLLGTLNMEFAGQVHASGLIFDVLLSDSLAHLSGRADKIRTCPERRESMQMGKLVSEDVSTGSLESVNDLVRSMASIRLNKQMNMIGPNRQRVNLPVVLCGHFMKHFFQAIRHCSLEHTCTSLRAPHKVILHRVDGVTTSAVWFFVDWHHSINRATRSVFREGSLTLRSTSHCE
jgi:hypothetical protein